MAKPRKGDRERRAPGAGRSTGATGPRRGTGVATGVLLAAGALVLALVLTRNSRPAPGRHPDARPNAEALRTVDPARYAGYPRVERTYALAAQVKPVLDGLYCYCRCREHSGHHSLLDCFRSDHGAGCDVCLEQALLAYRLARQGASLETIRQETDRLFGGRRG